MCAGMSVQEKESTSQDLSSTRFVRFHHELVWCPVVDPA